MEPILDLKLQRAHAVLALTMLAKLPIEQGLAAFMELQQQMIEAEERWRRMEAAAIVGAQP